MIVFYVSLFLPCPGRPASKALIQSNGTVDILERIIENLTSDEVRRFKILSNRFKADEEKKLLVLFDAIRAGGFKDIEDQVITQFYGGTDAKSKNSYYRLRNKLLSNLEKSLLFYHFNYKNSLESFSNIQLAILYRERGLFKEAYYNLKKAEKVAIAHDQFNLLEVIYDEMLKLSNNLELEIEKILNRRRENIKKLEIIRANSEILGMVTQQLLKRNYARSKKSESIIETLENIKNRLEEHKDIFQSGSGKIMIMKTVVSILLQKGAYRELEEYVQSAFQDFEASKIFNKDNHPTRLLMRIWRLNSLLKLLDLDQALADLALFAKELKMYDKQYYNQYAFFYYSAHVYALKLSGKLDESGELLKDALAQKDLMKNDTHELYLLLSLSDQYFSQSLFPQSLDIIKKISSHKSFNLFDEELRFFIHIFEIVSLYEASQHSKVDQKYKSLKKTYKHFLKDDFYSDARKFLEIIIRMNTAAIEGRKVFLKSAYKGYVAEFSRSEIGDNQVILYDVYLKSKLEQRPYYELLVEEVNKRVGKQLTKA